MNVPIKFEVSLASIKKGLALLDIDIPSDEELIAMVPTGGIMFSSEDLKSPDFAELSLGLSVLAAGKMFENA